ncbi:hypothetical protein [Phocoenobacter atlanticus]|uniref:hypothetical protein n=1 Tax=Phocoenobacter atlanticus TaxID=3416742 RepID=UPI0027435BCA|nr:hypothetical protein [Pasteurella atlantica]MDP8101717.1 hypothetical protein [Pasteurella atlantica]
MLNKLQQNMPQRNLKLANAGDGGLLNSIIIGLVGVLGGGFMVYMLFFMAQGILKDRELIDNSVPVTMANVSGECSSRRLLTSCDVKIAHQGQIVERDFTFVDFSSDDYRVEIIVQKDDPSNMNVDLAINKMSNRIMTAIGLAIIGILMFLGGIITFLGLPKKQRLKNIMNEPANQPWQFVSIPAQIDGDLITYTTDIDGNATEMEIDFEGRKPIILSVDDDNTYLLGIQAKTQKTSVLLCQKLKNINFSKDEKRTLIDIINAS